MAVFTTGCALLPRPWRPAVSAAAPAAPRRAGAAPGRPPPLDAVVGVGLHVVPTQKGGLGQYLGGHHGPLAASTVDSEFDHLVLSHRSAPGWRRAESDGPIPPTQPRWAAFRQASRQRTLPPRINAPA